ncbi:MAG TPA: DNA polymerase III subunit gamma/tau, partial [Pirellulaceae bacterium]
MTDSSVIPPGATAKYEVVARRYRPQAFESLVGQDPILRTLRNAIESNRVGHAYLFTGSRGVGKTSAARIFAKCLNCEQGLSPRPCNACESCIAVSTGDDIDVLEIDGASNRGIDEIRQLRANIGVRPSRSRFKIYIIDEVHMLSRDAFNALLKTLEEPPPHVKFIFCTTDVEKVPITVLSRCQRFDFAPIRTELIAQQLAVIAEREGVEADPDALWLLARRAEGSLRDSQSLLEQVLSSTSERITESTIHQLLGTARHQQVHDLVEALVHRNAGQAIACVDQAIHDGVEVGQLCEQLLTLLRDVMVAAVDGSSELLLSARAESLSDLKAWSDRWGLATVLSSLQILEQTLSRMRMSMHRRALLEIAIVQIANLENLAELIQLLAPGRIPANA